MFYKPMKVPQYQTMLTWDFLKDRWHKFIIIITTVSISVNNMNIIILPLPPPLINIYPWCFSAGLCKVWVDSANAGSTQQARDLQVFLFLFSHAYIGFGDIVLRTDLNI